jgi:hypothetical protein
LTIWPLIYGNPFNLFALHICNFPHGRFRCDFPSSDLTGLRGSTPRSRLGSFTRRHLGVCSCSRSH